MFSLKLKKLRSDKKITQTCLAKDLNVSIGTVGNWETGSRKPDSDMLKRIADYFGVTVDYLIGRSADKYPTPNISEENVRFPVIGDIAAGFDSIALESWDGDIIEVPRSYLNGRNESSFFVLRVKGDSMYPEYREGDNVLILKQNSIDSLGQVAAVLYDDDIATLKRIEYKQGEFLKLIPINPNVPPIKISGERLNHCRIIGIPKVLIRKIED